MVTIRSPGTIRSDEPIQTVSIEWSDDGIRFRPLAVANIAASPYYCQPPAASAYYRLKSYRNANGLLFQCNSPC